MSDRIGSAEWINPEAVAEKFSYEQGSFWLGRTIDQGANAIGVKDDRHILIVGGTRGGKGTTLLINNLCLWPGSAIVIDPKGENATVTAARRAGGGDFCEGMGQSVHVLDPYQVAHVADELRSSFNPLDWLDVNDPYVTKKAERLATSLIPFKDKEEDYWDNEARALLGALFLHVATFSMYHGKRTLMTVRDLVMRGDIHTYEAAEQEGEYIDPPLDLLWTAMMNNDICNGYVSDQGNYYRDLLAANAKQWSGIRGAVKVATDFINSPGMRDSLASSSFSFNDLKTSEQGTTVYLSIPQDFINTDRGWMRMMVDITATQAKLTPGQPRCGHPTLMLLDEFAGLERMDVLEQSIAQLAGYGVKMACVVQNLAQLKTVYKESWETFVSGSGVKVFFSIDDNFTRDYISKQAGETEIIREGQSVNKSEAENESETKGKSRSKTRGTSTNKSKTESSNKGKGRNLGISLNRSGNRGENYDSDGGLMQLFPTETGTNKSRGGGFAGNYSRNRNWGISTSETQGSGSNESETIGTTESYTRGMTRTSGTGRSETFHKRFLIEPHDVGYKFARVDDLDDIRYPGIALVMISGDRPMPIRKCNYFEDPVFHGRFEPHPDHDFTPLTADELDRPFSNCVVLRPPMELLEFRMLDDKLLRLVFDGVPRRELTDINLSVGKEVEVDDPVIRWKSKGSVSHVLGDPPPVLSPVKGIVYEVFRADNYDGFQGSDTVVRIETIYPVESDIGNEALNVWDAYYRRARDYYNSKDFEPWIAAIGWVIGGFILLATANKMGIWAVLPVACYVLYRLGKPLFEINNLSIREENETEESWSEKKARVEELEGTTNVMGRRIATGLVSFAICLGFISGWATTAGLIFILILVRAFPYIRDHTRNAIKMLVTGNWSARYSENIIEVVENESDQVSLVEQARRKRIERDRKTYRFNYELKKFQLVES